LPIEIVSTTSALSDPHGSTRSSTINLCSSYFL